MNWFDSDYYHILYSNRDLKEAEHFIKNLVNHLKIKKGSKILDLACGKGRHSIYLNKKGFDVTGYDNSEKSIEKAKKFKNNLLRFKRKEMTEEYEGSFDFIFNLFTSFGYISENHNINTLKSIDNALVPNGILVIDFLNIHKVKSELIEEEIKKISDISFDIKRSINKKFIEKKIKITHNKKTLKFNEKVMNLKLKDFEKYFSIFNYSLLSVFGDYNLNIFNKKSSERLIMVIKKSQPLKDWDSRRAVTYSST